MREAMASLPVVATNMPDQLFLSLSRPVRDILTDGFLEPSSVMEFKSSKDFEDYARRNLELVLFWGEALMRRGDFDGPVLFIDHAVLRKLLIYKERFRADGLQDHEKCADAFVDEWHGQIESERDFTRRQMWFRVELNWPLYNEGILTPEEISKSVKVFADGLVNLGYTPKWLSEFDDLTKALK